MFIFLGLIALMIVWRVLVAHSTRISHLEKQLAELGSTRPVASGVPVAPAQVATNPGSEALRTAESQTTPQANVVRDEETSGRVLGRIGIGAVVIGVSFFLKFAYDNTWISPFGLVMIGIIVGMVLLGIGQVLRNKYLGYSDLLMGGGIGVLHLSIFSAHFFHHLISPFTARMFMFVVTILAFVISIVNATPVLAMVGVIGGFATPLLVRTGENMMLPLFGYLTILNLGTLGVSFFKKWSHLIAASLIGTVINFVVWLTFYKEEMLAPTLIFCTISFLIFLAASVARAVIGKAAADQANYALLGANAFLYAVMGYMLLEPRHEGVLSFAAVAVALVFLIVAFIVNKANPEDKALNIFLPGLAVTFLSVAVPLQFSGPWIAVAWFVESVALYVIASFIGNRGFQVMGVTVYILGLLNFFFWNFPSTYDPRFIVFFNSHFVILVLAIVAAYSIAFMYFRFGSVTTDIQKRGITAFVVIANILTLYALSSQIVFYHNAQMARASEQYQQQQSQANLYNTGYDTSAAQQQASQVYYAERTSITNRSHTYVSILWVIYAAILTAIGFGRRLASARRLGLALFIITAIKVLFDVWSLGQLYRIISFTVFGVIALVASFAYTKYKDRLKEIV